MGITSVTLGTFYTDTTGKTVLGGAGGSGLDTQSLIKGLVAAKSQSITADQDSIKVSDGVSTALTKFQALVSAFQTNADALRSPTGVNNAAYDAFKYTKATVSSAASTYISVSASPGADIQSYNISDISSVASNATQSSSIFDVASASADATVNSGGAYFNAGTFTFNGASITVNSGDSLTNIAASFNAVKATTGVGVSVVAIDSTHYKLSFVSTKTGTDHNFDLSTATDGSGVLTNLGLSAATAATNAVFKLNNIQITRQSNAITDVISNVTFNILDKTPDAVTNYIANIKPDVTTAQNTIVSFVKAYNDLKTFAATQGQINADGTYASTAVLANNQTFRQTMASINAQVGGIVSGITTSGDPDSLAGVGITFTNQAATDTTPAVNNIMTVDDSKLNSSLTTNFEGVKNLFSFNFVADNPNLAVYSHTAALATTAFTLSVDVPSHSYIATFPPSTGLSPVSLEGSALGGGTGFSLTGPAGSVLEGLVMLYVSNSSATINVNASQGIADQIYSTSDAATKKDSGTISLALSSIKTQTTSLNEDITRLNKLVAEYQQQLTKQFAALEQAISKSNTLLQSLNANSNAALTASGH